MNDNNCLAVSDTILIKLLKSFSLIYKVLIWISDMFILFHVIFLFIIGNFTAITLVDQFQVTWGILLIW